MGKGRHIIKGGQLELHAPGGSVNWQKCVPKNYLTRGQRVWGTHTSTRVCLGLVKDLSRGILILWNFCLRVAEAE